MTPPAEFKTIADETFQAIFGRDCPYTVTELREKFARDIQLPTKVQDSTTGEDTWTAMPNAEKYITDKNSSQRDEKVGWMQPQQTLHGIKDILKLWREINYITTERAYNCERVYASDPVYGSSDVYMCTNCNNCQKILYCDGDFEANHAIACQRSGNLNYCIRVDDSNSCTNSYSVVCCSKISNSLFIQDASDLYECMFCSHISNRQFCIANIQFEKEAYYQVKTEVIDWILRQS